MKCEKCGSTNVSLDGGSINGFKTQCNNCNYIKTLNVEEVNVCAIEEYNTFLALTAGMSYTEDDISRIEENGFGTFPYYNNKDLSLLSVYGGYINILCINNSGSFETTYTIREY